MADEGEETWLYEYLVCFDRLEMVLSIDQLASLLFKLKQKAAHTMLLYTVDLQKLFELVPECRWMG